MTDKSHPLHADASRALASHIHKTYGGDKVHNHTDAGSNTTKHAVKVPAENKKRLGVDLRAHGYTYEQKKNNAGETEHVYTHPHNKNVAVSHTDHKAGGINGHLSDYVRVTSPAKKKIAEAVESLSEDLNAALKDLKSELAGGKEYTPEMLKGIADDWEVNPALLIRKFKEATGKDPADYKIMDKETMGKVVFEAGKKKATEWVKHNIQGGTSSLLGKPFTYKDKETGQESQYVAAAWTGRGLHGWNITKQAIYTISFPNSTAAAKYIDAHILSVK